jgi:hypothetical protein
MEADELVEALGEMLAHMSPRTRRPIRFIQPETTQPAVSSDSSLLSGEDDNQPAKPGKQPLAIVR